MRVFVMGARVRKQCVHLGSKHSLVSCRILTKSHLSLSLSLFVSVSAILTQLTRPFTARCVYIVSYISHSGSYYILSKRLSNWLTHIKSMPCKWKNRKTKQSKRKSLTCKCERVQKSVRMRCGAARIGKWGAMCCVVVVLSFSHSTINGDDGNIHKLCAQENSHKVLISWFSIDLMGFSILI